MNNIALNNNLARIVSDYQYKIENMKEHIEEFLNAQKKFQRDCLVLDTYSGSRVIDEQYIHESNVEASLKKSAWRATYQKLQIENIATAKDKKLFEQSLENPPEFTIDNLRATFGSYIENPMGNILRGLAEVFCDLDPAYKSHDKVKIGVKGLPKRVILTGFNGYSSWGKDKLKDILNALAAYQGKPLVDAVEIEELLKEEKGLTKRWTYTTYFGTEKTYQNRGVWLKRFSNGNGHLYFDQETLKDINRALAEYYGDVLADCYDDDDTPKKKQESTAVSKDLQFYKTPDNVAERLLRDVHIRNTDKVLEPSCGDGALLKEIAKHTKDIFGIEIDSNRVNQCRALGFNVLQANFLETIPNPIYDKTIMNPPFYGTHYFKHIKHALKFLKDGGVLVAILPITARYDHGLIDQLPNKKYWNDLPVGSFSESGTNVNTTILTMWK